MTDLNLKLGAICPPTDTGTDTSSGVLSGGTPDEALKLPNGGYAGRASDAL
jgi:hypothetical protein